MSRGPHCMHCDHNADMHFTIAQPVFGVQESNGQEGDPCTAVAEDAPRHRRGLSGSGCRCPGFKALPTAPSPQNSEDPK